MVICCEGEGGGKVIYLAVCPQADLGHSTFWMSKLCALGTIHVGASSCACPHDLYMDHKMTVNN